MKRVRIKLKRGAKKNWSFSLYDSIESAYYITTDPEQTQSSIRDFSKTVTVSSKDVLEVEWLGSEWVYNDEDETFPKKTRHAEKYDNIAIGKTVATKRTTLEKVEVYTGWVRSGDVPLNQHDARDDIRIIRLSDVDEYVVDFSKFFYVSPTVDEMQEMRSSVVN